MSCKIQAPGALEQGENLYRVTPGPAVSFFQSSQFMTSKGSRVPIVTRIPMGLYMGTVL